MWPVKESLFLSSEGSSFLSVLVQCMDKRDTAGCAIVRWKRQYSRPSGNYIPSCREQDSQPLGTAFSIHREIKASVVECFWLTAFCLASKLGRRVLERMEGFPENVKIA